MEKQRLRTSWVAEGNGTVPCHSAINGSAKYDECSVFDW
ncbi:hypothetical protein BJF96_g8510 [Verticillium dahliae]|uniref:Uncharacterized protein n=1 Tax=Verticillium dahliae TaxID=27337 RepID=A0AA45AIH6_VERDA|nr:hypothetical protein BJF96_g8510 [Verticillium dahliae]